MNTKQLEIIAKALVAQGKGILAADESTSTAGKRLDSIGLENTEENRRAMRDMFFTAEGMENYISGVIMYEETLSQSTAEGRKFVGLLAEKGVVSGIKVDLGLEPLDGSDVEKVTKGLEGLQDRLVDYYEKGARFAKWRAVYAVSGKYPSVDSMVENADRLAEYAFLCQEAGIVPIVEPEILMDNGLTDYDIDRSFQVNRDVQKALFRKLQEKGVYMPGLLLKPSMVIHGATSDKKAEPKEVAARTLECLKLTVPPQVAGVVFLSGGQTDELATLHLDLMNKQENEKRKDKEKAKTVAPWPLTFSYGRALQGAALQAWKEEGAMAGQKVFLHRAKMNSLASLGKYDPSLEG